MIVIIVVPWAICFTAYTFMHYTYAADKRAAAEANATDGLVGGATDAGATTLMDRAPGKTRAAIASAEC